MRTWQKTEKASFEKKKIEIYKKIQRLREEIELIEAEELGPLENQIDKLDDEIFEVEDKIDDIQAYILV